VRQLTYVDFFIWLPNFWLICARNDEKVSCCLVHVADESLKDDIEGALPSVCEALGEIMANEWNVQGTIEWAAFEEKCPEPDIVLEVQYRMLAIAAKEETMRSIDLFTYEMLGICFMFVNDKIVKGQATSSIASRSAEIMRLAGQMQRAALSFPAHAGNSKRWIATRTAACAAIAASFSFHRALNTSCPSPAPPMAEFADMACRAMDAWARCVRESSPEVNYLPPNFEQSLLEIWSYLDSHIKGDAPWAEVKPAVVIAQSAAAVLMAVTKARDEHTEPNTRLIIRYAASIQFVVDSSLREAYARSALNAHTVKEFWAASASLMEATAKGILACAASATMVPADLVVDVLRKADEFLGDDPALMTRWQR